MKFIKSIAFLILLSPFFLTNCTNDPVATGAAAYIPATSTSVTGIDVQRLMQKADFESVKQMAFYKKMVSESSKKSEVIAAVLENPAKSGIDLNDRVYLTTDVEKDNPKQVTFHVLIPLSNVADFEKLVKEAEVDFETQNGLKIFQPENGAAFVWNDELLTITGGDNGDMDVLPKAKQLFEMGENEPVALKGGFNKAMNADHDLVTWFSSSTIADNPTANMALRFIDIAPEALKENYVHAYSDFEDGRIVGHSDFYIKKELGKGLIGRFFKNGTNTDFSKVLPSENLVFAMVGAIDFRGIDKFLSEQPQTKDKADFVLNSIGGLERKKILEMLNGDVMLASYSENEIKDGNYIIAFAIKNPAKASAMLEKGVADKKLIEIEKGYYKLVSIGGEDFQITVNKGLAKILHKNDMLIYSSNEELLQKIKNDELGKNPIAAEVLKKFNDQTIAGWFDFDGVQKKALGLQNDFIKDMQFNINNKGAGFILETSNPNENSLKSIFKMINEDYLKKNTEAM